MIYNLGQECYARFDGEQCSSYLIMGEKNIIIDTVPNKYANEYILSLEKYINPKNVDCVILTSAVPQRAGCIAELLKYNPQIEVYASVAGLRNLKEILNKSFDEHMCKNKEKVLLGDIEFQFYITPNLPNPDTLMVYCAQLNSLFCGDMFSNSDNKKLTSILPFAKNALGIIVELAPAFIYSCTSWKNVDKTDKIASPCAPGKILIVYTSLSGSNEQLAVAAAETINKAGLVAEMLCLDAENPVLAADKLFDASALLFGTYTHNRTLPRIAWDFISSIDVNLANAKPYFVFSSYGWSCEGSYIANELLSLLKMRRACKPVECVFTPSTDDIANIQQATVQLIKLLSNERKS